jgi:AcrR family transcriptional regulator
MSMTGNADETRLRLIEAATRGFAEEGVHTASLLEITRQAGQRNRGAVHYHFGSREGMLVAVLEQHVDLLAVRERELLAIARQQPDDDLASVVAAFVRPAVELGDLGWEGRCYLVWSPR